MSFIQQNQRSPHLSPSSYIVKNALINDINTLNVYNTYVITAINKHQDTEFLTVQEVEAGDFNHSGGYCYKLFFFCHMCLPCSSLLFFICDWHAFTFRQTCLLHTWVVGWYFAQQYEAYKFVYLFVASAFHK